MHQIGAGSVGPVFRGEDGETRQPVVIKAIRAGLPPERAAAVATALAALRDRLPAHPSLVPLLGTGVVDDEPYAVSPLVDGDSLDVALRHDGPAHVVDALPRLRALADALDAAAALDNDHGGLHPRDILVSVERTVLTGTGLAPILERAGAAPPVRRPYTAPEVCDGGGSSAAADQYALAAIAYEWLTGRRLGAPADLQVRVAGLTQEDADELTAVFRRALADAPDERFSTASGFVDAVAIAASSVAPAARPASRIRRAAAPRLVFDEPDEGAAVEPAAPAAPAPTPAPRLPVAAPDPLDLPLTMRPEHTALPPEWERDSLLGVDAPADDSPDSPTVQLDADDATARRLEPEVPPLVEEPPPVAPPPPSPRSPASRSRVPAAAPASAAAPTAGPSLPVAAAAFAAFVVLAFLGGWALLRWSTPRGTAPAGATVSSAASQPPPSADPVPAAAASSPVPQPPAASPAPPPTAPEQGSPAPPAARPSPAPAAAPAGRQAAAGRLLVRSTPAGAEVFVNGTRRGVTPLTLRELAAGTYTVRVTRDGFAPAEQRIAIDRARPSRTVSLTMARARTTPAAPPPAAAATGTFSFDTRPRGARVLVDGRPVGVTPVTVTVPAGAHAVRFERDGYLPITTTASVPARSGARVAVTLTPERR
ncbi:MAG: PEGA domain-containing protein [Vicinamibacterales bacterium]